MQRPGLQLTLSTNNICYVNMEKLLRISFNSHLWIKFVVITLLPCCFPFRLLYDFRTETHSDPMHAALYYFRGHRPKASLLKIHLYKLHFKSRLLPLSSQKCAQFVSCHKCRFFLVHFRKTLFLGCDLLTIFSPN